jgi:cob(I)alamin adenosyltransferase
VNEKGYIQVYTGNGKGKSSAAIGSAVRAAGAGLKTFFVQFMKVYPYSEVKSLAKLSEFITLKQYGNDDFIFRKENPTRDEINKTGEGLIEATEAMLSGKFDLVILDEVCVSIYFKLFSTEEIIEFLRQKPENVEVILTGRYCPDKIIEIADLVSEIKEVKHYYTKGVLSRKGIDS